MSHDRSSEWDSRCIRAWVVRQVTMTADNSQPWHRKLTAAGAYIEGDDRAKGEYVVDTLRALIASESHGTARELLLALTDLGDGLQTEQLGAHYGGNE